MKGMLDQLKTIKVHEDFNLMENYYTRPMKRKKKNKRWVKKWTKYQKKRPAQYAMFFKHERILIAHPLYVKALQNYVDNPKPGFRFRTIIYDFKIKPPEKRRFIKKKKKLTFNTYCGMQMLKRPSPFICNTCA